MGQPQGQGHDRLDARLHQLPDHGHTPHRAPTTSAATTPVASGVATGEIVAVLAAMTLACTRPRPCGTLTTRSPHTTGDTVTGKVTPDHLRRDAYLYVRQSTMAQVMHNTESTLRHYDLRGRAVAQDWPADRVIDIDIDQGHSGASAADRAGLQRLVAEVSMGKARIVLGLQCSRLARNNADRHRLLELCALNQTLRAPHD